MHGEFLSSFAGKDVCRFWKVMRREPGTELNWLERDFGGFRLDVYSVVRLAGYGLPAEIHDPLIYVKSGARSGLYYEPCLRNLWAGI